MSHDTEAAYASSEVADIIMVNQNNFFGSFGTRGAWSVYAGRESGHQWPLTDGVILAENATHKDVKIAFEYKRPNEGVHGILTALGQSFAYLEKGYDASVMVIPETYSSHCMPGQHVKRVLEATSPDVPISIYTYKIPNLSATRPFHGKLQCVRDISLPSCKTITRSTTAIATGNVSTLWAHMREGMSHPDAFFRFCQGVKVTSATGADLAWINLPSELVAAIHRIDGSADPYKYLSNTSGDAISDKAWRYTWFNYYFWKNLIPIWASSNPFVVNNTPTRIRISEESWQGLFAGRSDSIKEKLVKELNEGTISEAEAWEEYAKKVRKDAHSYREVIDSGLYHIGYLNPEGTLTELGYKFVEACERVGVPYIGIPMEIFKASVLQNGQYGAMLHYIYRLSEEKFDTDLFAFSERDRNGNYIFKEQDYLVWIDDYFANELHISKKSTERAGGTRKPFQAELAFLKKMGFVRTNGRRAAYRVGVGLEIDWPQVQSSMLYFQNL